MKPATPIFPDLDLEVTEIAKNQDEYFTLPAYLYKDSHGTILIRWKLNWKERFKLFFTGNLYHIILTFNQPLQPIKLMCGDLDLDEKEYLKAMYEEKQVKEINVKDSVAYKGLK